MKRSLTIASVAILLVVATFGVARAQKTSGAKKRAVVYVAADQAKFKEMSPGVSTAALRGNADTGPHATFTKFVPGYDAGMHYHTADISIAVIKGAYLYKDENGEKRVGAGDYLRVPGGHKHWSGGDKTEGALFYEEGSGKFDNVPVK